MTISKRTAILALMCVVAALYGYNLYLGRAGGRARGAAGQAATTALSIPARFAYEPDFRDPFLCPAFMEDRPAGAKVVAAAKARPRKEEIKLPSCLIGGIVYTPDNPMALFVYNGKSNLVKAGDVIDSMHVKKITRDSVYLVYKARRFTLGKK